MPCDLVRYLVSLQDVLEAGDTYSEAFHGSQEYQNLVLSVGMAMNESLAADDLQYRLEFKVPADGWSGSLLCLLELDPVLAGSGETVGKKGLHSHPALREARSVLVTPVGLLDVFTKGELDPAGCCLEQHFIRLLTEPELDDGILPANRIGRTMQQVAGSHSSGQLTLDVDAFRIDHIRDANHGSGGQS